MAAIMGKTEVGVREIGSTVTVPDNPKAKLMYYLSCICSLLDMSDQGNVSTLTNYSRHYALTEAETDALVVLCVLLSPDELLDKVMFQNDSLCGNSTNKFYELSAVRSTLLLSNSILIGGQARSIRKIMAFKQVWLLDNWIIPMVTFKPRLDRMVNRGRGAPSNGSGGGCCCTIL